MNSFCLPIRLSRPVAARSTTGTSRCTVRIAHQRRHKSDARNTEGLSPVLEEYYAKRPETLQQMLTGQSKPGKDALKFGKMPDDSIFGKDDTKPLPKKSESAEAIKKRKREEIERAEFKDDRNLEILNKVLDPFPRQRWQFERQQIIKASRWDWRMTKKEYLRKTERRSALNSMPLKTSRKKLGALARQISGKSIDEALLQMRFSKKRTALEVMKHLEEARDHAIVRWGMGLGKVEEREGQPVTITLRDGTKRHIKDRTALYIEHAMVRSRKPALLPEYRARGQMNMIRRKFTSMRLVLREEHTRIRECQERVERKARRAPFEPLPDRPITQQRQYVLW